MGEEEDGGRAPRERVRTGSSSPGLGLRTKGRGAGGRRDRGAR